MYRLIVNTVVMTYKKIVNLEMFLHMICLNSYKVRYDCVTYNFQIA